VIGSARAGIVAALLWIAFSAAAQTTEDSAPATHAVSAPAAIPFRKDDDVGGLAVKVVLGLGISIAVALAVLVVLRRYVSSAQRAPGRRMRIVESMRLTPKSALFLVEVDRETLLIGQHGESLVLLNRPHGDGRPPQPVDHG